MVLLYGAEHLDLEMIFFHEVTIWDPKMAEIDYNEMKREQDMIS